MIDLTGMTDASSKQQPPRDSCSLTTGNTAAAKAAPKNPDPQRPF
jgi:hypothetical protein